MKTKHTQVGEPVLISIRMSNGPPETQAFLAQTDAWLDEVKADFRREMGAELPGNGVLFAHDVLCEIHGAEASWALFDVTTFERWVRENAPAFAVILPTMLADLACFSNYLARTGRFAIEQAIGIERRTIELCAAALGCPRKKSIIEN